MVVNPLILGVFQLLLATEISKPDAKLKNTWKRISESLTEERSGTRGATRRFIDFGSFRDILPT